MLDAHLIAKMKPLADKENVVFWKNYRITVLQSRLFRLEYSENKKFRDGATQSIWFRDMQKQNFIFRKSDSEAIIKTKEVKLILKEKRADCRIILNGGKSIKIDNSQNLMGTNRTLDGYDGEYRYDRNQDKYVKINLDFGVCSKNGVAVIDDSKSLTISSDGMVKPEIADGSDEYIFAYGKNYRDAVKALYMITGQTPLVPKFALGNWWSRYHAYTDKEYLRLLNRFEERDIPLTVATIDMDWHWSKDVDKQKKITESGKNTSYYVGELDINLGWTGYSWNTELFPDYKKFLKDVKAKNLKITLNLHPSDGVRWWEDSYEEMARAMGIDPNTQQNIAFNVSDTNFLNNYFSILHKPYENDGVDFWWMDWQSGRKSPMEGLDPLWALNHYHYLDNASNHFSPLILSRYSGVGSHRYPLGFSGDTMITWNTLKYLPEFTATATNVGYTWWSHDIGGHCQGEKSDEMFVRHVQFGVFSPINRLHCVCWETVSKEPLYYLNGSGCIAENWLRFRHQLIPFLYSQSYLTHKDGEALIEPLYYQWDCSNAYKYKTEYLFGGQLLVVPVFTKLRADGWARIKTWLPQGKWTDIFTGDEYNIHTGGEVKTLLRSLDSIPVLIKAGGILPLSKDKGNSIENPVNLDVCIWSGDGEYTLFEDGRTKDESAEFFTCFKTNEVFKSKNQLQVLEISSTGEPSVIPKNRKLRILFKNIGVNGEVKLYKNGEELQIESALTDCAAVEFVFEPFANYRIEVKHAPRSWLQKQKDRSLEVMLRSEGITPKRYYFWEDLKKTNSIEEYNESIEKGDVSKAIKERLKETL